MELRDELRCSIAPILGLTKEQRQGKKFILVIGPPCVGKTTLCRDLAKKLNAARLSMGELLRERGESDQEVRKLVDAGKQVSPEIKRKVLREAILSRKETTFVIDGYLEADLVEELDATLLYLHCSDEKLKERFEKRKSLEERKDDSLTKIEDRIKTWHQVHDPLLQRYPTRRKQLDASGTSEKLLEDALSMCK